MVCYNVSYQTGGNTMKIEKKIVKKSTISAKITDEQNQKLEALAKKSGVTKSSLVAQLIGIGYKQITKNKTF